MVSCVILSDLVSGIGFRFASPFVFISRLRLLSFVSLPLSLLCLVLSCLMSCLLLCHLGSYLVLSDMLSSLVLSCLVLSCLVLSCPDSCLLPKDVEVSSSLPDKSTNHPK